MLCHWATKSCWSTALAWERPFTKLARDVLGACVIIWTWNTNQTDSGREIFVKRIYTCMRTFFPFLVLMHPYIDDIQHSISKCRSNYQPAICELRLTFGQTRCIAAGMPQDLHTVTLLPIVTWTSSLEETFSNHLSETCSNLLSET
jgi:hypothetical protein